MRSHYPAILLAVVLGGCSNNVYTSCHWPDESAVILNLRVPSDAEHLVRDVALASANLALRRNGFDSVMSDGLQAPFERVVVRSSAWHRSFGASRSAWRHACRSGGRAAANRRSWS